MLTRYELMSILHYNPETGNWIWVNPANHNTRLCGKRAGTRRSDSYLKIRINGIAYYASHLANLYMTGKWPIEEMDHKDRDPSNDKWTNLREATSSQNKYNRDQGRETRGVYKSGSKWWAMVGSNQYVGTFDTFEEASLARDVEAFRLAGDFAFLNGIGDLH